VTRVAQPALALLPAAGWWRSERPGRGGAACRPPAVGRGPHRTWRTSPLRGGCAASGSGWPRVRDQHHALRGRGRGADGPVAAPSSEAAL